MDRMRRVEIGVWGDGKNAGRGRDWSNSACLCPLVLCSLVLAIRENVVTEIVPYMPLLFLLSKLSRHNQKVANATLLTSCEILAPVERQSAKAHASSICLSAR